MKIVLYFPLYPFITDNAKNIDNKKNIYFIPT